MKNPHLAHILAIVLATQLSPPLLAQESKEVLIEALMTAENESELQSAISKAKKAGLPEQMFLEARFMLLINQDDEAGLAALAPKLTEIRQHYSSENTLIFATPEDFESIVHYTQALDALQKSDLSLFKKHITEAFWLGPQHGAQFAPHIEAVRLREAMGKVSFDFDRRLKQLIGGKEESNLTQILGEKDLLLLHFWSPWVQSSLDTIPDFIEIKNTSKKQKIAVASILLSGGEEATTEAQELLKKEFKQAGGHWFQDPTKNSLATQFRVSRLPTFVLISKAGKVLFNGDPNSPELWSQLQKIAPGMEPPEIRLPAESEEAED